MGLLPKPRPFSSGEAARPGMLGEPLSAHLACHLPTGPESCFTTPQLTVHVLDTLRGAVRSQGWDLRHRGGRGESMPTILKSNQEQG